ncbi:MAG: DUF2586 family protein [Bacteroidota bacterium]
MALPGVQIKTVNGGLGQLVQTDDALTGLILQGPAASGLALGVPTLLTSLEDAKAIGITEQYDTDNTVRVYKHIREFYAEAGLGAKLWIILISQAVSMTDMADKANAQYAKVLLNAADGNIRMLGITRSPANGYTATITTEIDADVLTAVDNAHELAQEYAEMYKPFRVVVEGFGYTGTAGTLADLKQKTASRVSVMLGDSSSGSGAAIGVLLGRLANVPVMRNPGRVKDGALSIQNAYLASETLRQAEGDVEVIHDKGFITLRRHIRKSGYYFTSDPTATASTDDYNSFARGRVIDKVVVIAYATFVNEILDEVEIDENGRIETVKAKYYQSIIENAVNNSMTVSGEISLFEAQIDVDQNVLSTGKICIEGRITPVGYATQIVFELGLTNPAINQ